MGTVKTVAGAEQYQKSIAFKDRGATKKEAGRAYSQVKINLHDVKGIVTVNKETFYLRFE